MVAEYRELIDLQRPHVDGFLAETIASVNEAKAVLSAAQQSGSRIMLGLTVMDDDGCRLRSGEPLKDALDAAAAFDPLAIVINCSKTRGGLAGNASAAKIWRSFWWFCQRLHRR